MDSDSDTELELDTIEQREEFFAELCAKHDFQLRRVYERGRKYMVRKGKHRFALYPPGDLAFLQILSTRDRVRTAFASSENDDFPKEEFGTMFIEEFLDPYTLDIDTGTALEIAYCCVCGNECNPASQTCGACPRKKWAQYSRT